MRRRIALGVLALVVAACASEEPELEYAAPAQVRATLVLEPPVVGVGQVADLVLGVVTPPGRSVRPFDPPSEIPGFVVIEREPQGIARERARWVHRTRLRLRAVEVGRFAFPAGAVEVVAAEGAVETISFEALPLEVVSVMGEHPARASPYGVRLLPLSRVSRGGLLGAFGAGAAFTLATIGLLLLARRRLAAPIEGAGPPSEVAAPVPVWEQARDELIAARSALAGDPAAALDAAALALRRYAVRRFGGDANVRTTQELEVSTPPFTLTTRWSRFVALLGDIDAARFPRPSRETPGAAAALLDRAEAFVEDTVPAEARR